MHHTTYKRPSLIALTHIPKTAGSSLRKGLQESLGQQMVLDYSTPPTLSDSRKPATGLELRLGALRNRWFRFPRPRLVFGHFALDKYLGFATKFGAFFRDPIDRTMSNYYYAHQEHVELSEYSRRFNMINIYSLYLGRIPLERLDFVGITEEYEISCRLFQAIFNIPLAFHRERVGKVREYQVWLEQAGALTEVREAQRFNYATYDAARYRFDMLCELYLA